MLRIWTGLVWNGKSFQANFGLYFVHLTVLFWDRTWTQLCYRASLWRLRCRDAVVSRQRNCDCFPAANRSSVLLWRSQLFVALILVCARQEQFEFLWQTEFEKKVPSYVPQVQAKPNLQHHFSLLLQKIREASSKAAIFVLFWASNQEVQALMSIVGPKLALWVVFTLLNNHCVESEHDTGFPWISAETKRFQNLIISSWTFR